MIFDEQDCPAIHRTRLGGFLPLVHDNPFRDDPPVKRAHFVDPCSEELVNSCRPGDITNLPPLQESAIIQVHGQAEAGHSADDTVFCAAKPLEPEESETLTAGLTWRTGFGLSGSLDLYRIDVDKRFSSSATVTVTPAIRAQLVALGVPGASSFTSISRRTRLKPLEWTPLLARPSR